MLSILRAPFPPRTASASETTVPYDQGKSSVRFHGAGAEYAMTHSICPGESVLTPPFHFHVTQTEHFKLKSGHGLFFLGLARDPYAVVNSADPNGRRKVTIPAGRYHRFENVSTTEPLVVDIHLEPEDYEGEQKFFRNFFGYLDDCKKAGTAPSIFQLMVFLYTSGTPLALPAPNEAVGRIISRAFVGIMAFIGRFVLGYQVSYIEYYEESKSR